MQWEEEEECNVSISEDSIGSEQPEDGEKKIPLSLPFNRGQDRRLRINVDIENQAHMRESLDLRQQLEDKAWLTVRNCVSRQEEASKLPSLSPRAWAKTPPLWSTSSSSTRIKQYAHNERRTERERPTTALDVTTITERGQTEKPKTTVCRLLVIFRFGRKTGINTSAAETNYFPLEKL